MRSRASPSSCSNSMAMPAADVSVATTMRTTRPRACTISLEPGRRSFSSTFSSSGICSSVSTKMPPSLMLRVKSENSASTVAYSMRTVTGARCERRRSRAVRVSVVDRSAIVIRIVRPRGRLDRENAARRRGPWSGAGGALSPRQRAQVALLAQADPAALRHDDVVEQRDAEQRPRLDETARHLAVLGARRRVPARVVVDHDQGGGTLAERRPEHLARMDEARRQGAPGRHHLAEQTMAAVEQQQVELLVRRVAQARVEVAEDVLGPADRIARAEPALREPAPELERRQQRGGLGRTDARLPFELGRNRAREAVETRRA